MTYKVSGEVTLHLSWSDDADTNLEVVHPELDIYVDASDSFEPLSYGSTSQSELFEVEVDADSPEEAEQMVIDSLSDTERWDVTAEIAREEIVSAYVDDVEVTIFNVEPVDEE